MSSQAFGAFVEIENGPKITGPPPALQKPVYQGSEESPHIHELDQMAWGQKYNGPKETPSGFQTPATPNELEMSRPSSPQAPEAVEALQSFSNPSMNRFRVLSACLVCFGNGMNDSAPGPLIPYIEKDYKIGYAVVSLIFVTNAIGYISTASFANALHNRYGRAKTLIIAEALMIAGYIPIVCRPPFPLVVISFLFLGLGMALNLAMNNTFCANLANSTSILGAFHGSYGIGGTIGPLIATSIVSHQIHWSVYYFISIGITSFNLFFAAWSFWEYEKDAPVQLLTAVERTASRPAASESGAPSNLLLLKRSAKNKTTILGAIFIFAYQGAEVSISGWVISFLIAYRGGDPAQVGYVTAGFWAGITLGRFCLAYPAHKIGERLSVLLLVFGAIIFEILVWVIPNVISNAVSVALVGLLLGPINPCGTVVFSRLLPRSLQMSSLSFISAFGSSGGAIAPFTTGILAQAVGTFVLHPICIVLFVVMMVCWLAMPKINKRGV